MASFEPRDRQVALHLRQMRLVELFNNLWVDNDPIVNDQIRDQFSNLEAFVGNRESLLMVDGMTALPQFDDQAAIVDLSSCPHLIELSTFIDAPMMLRLRSRWINFSSSNMLFMQSHLSKTSNRLYPTGQ